MRSSLFVLLFLLPFSLSQAAELQKLSVDNVQGHYRLYLHALLKAPLLEVEKIITDYNNLKRINPYLKQSQAEPMDENRHTLVHLITKSCVLFICYELLHDQRFEPMTDGVLTAVISTGNSDFKSGNFRWTLEAQGEMTSIIMETDVEPDFIIPPMIGPYLVEKKLREIALATVENIERYARSPDRQFPENID